MAAVDWVMDPGEMATEGEETMQWQPGYWVKRLHLQVWMLMKKKVCSIEGQCMCQLFYSF